MNCSKCEFSTDTEKGFKAHMSKSHGGYSLDDLNGAGITPNQRDIARSLAGNNSAREVTDQAPDTEPVIGQEKKTRKSSKAPAESPEVLAAKQRILRMRCSRMASLPYSLMANLMDEPSFKLSEQENEELTQSYLTLAESYGWEGASKIILWGDVLICHTAILMSKDRKQAILAKMESLGVSGDVMEQVEDLEAEKVA